MQLTRTLTTLLPLSVLLAGCDDPVTAGPNAELVGAYQLVTYQGWPLPYIDVETGFSLQGGTLELLPGGRFVKSDRRYGAWWSVEGDYFPGSDSIALVQDDGATLSLVPQDGVLRHSELIYVKDDSESPAEYRWREYELTACDEFVPNGLYVCPGSSTYFSTIWLRDNGRIDFLDSRPGATARGHGSYYVDEAVITADGMDARRSVGTLRDGVLTFDGWIYGEVQ